MSALLRKLLTNTKQIFCIIYCRVSSHKQAKEGHGLDAQEQRLRAYAKMKGYEVLFVFKDDVSGKKQSRDGLEQALSFLGTVPEGIEIIVLIDDLKRFARNTRLHFDLKDEIIERGGRLESPLFNFENTPEGKFIETIVAAQAELETDQNRRQVINRMKARLENGYWCFPDTIPGLKYVKEAGHGKVMRRDEPEASIYAEALEGFASGRFSNQAAVKNFLEYRLGRHLTVQAARNTLDRAVIYAAFIEYPKWGVKRTKGHHDALISIQTYLKIKERLESSLRKHTRKDENPDFPLRGRVTCTDCGKRYRAAWCAGRSSKYPKYWCANPECASYSDTIQRKDIEGSFELLLQNIKPQERTLEASKRRLLRRWDKKMTDVKEYHNSISRDANSMTDQVNELVDDIPSVRNATVRRAYEKRVEELEIKKEALEEKLGEMRPDNFDYRTALEELINFIKNPHKRWLNGSLPERHQVIDICFVKDLSYHAKQGYRTIEISPTFMVLTGYNPVSEKESLAELQRCGHGRN